MKSKYVFVTGLILLIIGLAVCVNGYSTDETLYEFGTSVTTFGSMVMIPGFLLALILELIIRYHELEEKRKSRLAEMKEKQAINRAKFEESISELKEEFSKITQTRKPKEQIVEVKYLGTGAIIEKNGTLGGTLLGGLIAGPLGAAIGATSPHSEEALHRFAIKYGDGKIEIKDLHPNSPEFKKLLKFVKWEDIQ